MSSYWFGLAKSDDLLRLNGPLGTFFLREVVGADLVSWLLVPVLPQ